MSKFMVGDEVLVISTKMTGVVASGFYWRDANGKPPTRDMIPVDLDNGDREYIAPDNLDYDAEVDIRNGT